MVNILTIIREICNERVKYRLSPTGKASVDVVDIINTPEFREYLKTIKNDAKTVS